MIYLAAAQLMLIAGLVWFIGRREQAHAQTLVDVMSAQDAERQLLLDRVQRPEILPVRRPMVPTETAGGPEERARDMEAYRRVGTVQPLKAADA